MEETGLISVLNVTEEKKNNIFADQNKREKIKITTVIVLFCRMKYNRRVYNQ